MSSSVCACGIMRTLNIPLCPEIQEGEKSTQLDLVGIHQFTKREAALCQMVYFWVASG